MEIVYSQISSAAADAAVAYTGASALPRSFWSLSKAQSLMQGSTSSTTSAAV